MKNFNEWILECPICNSKFKLKKCFESDNTYYVCDHYSIYIEEPIEELDFLRHLNIYILNMLILNFILVINFFHHQIKKVVCLH